MPPASGAVQPDGFAAADQIPPGEVAGRKVVVACDGDERPPEPPRHVLDESRLAAAGRAFEHHRKATRMAGFENGYLVADGT